MSNLKRLFQDAVRRYEQDTLYPAILGNGDGSTLYLADVPGFVWARVMKPSGATTTQVRCRNLTPVYDAPVMVREDPIDKVLEVIREDATAAIAFFQGQSNLAGLHAGQHGYYGSDPLRLDARQYMPLLVHPTDPPSMSVVIEPLTYTHNDVRVTWGGGQIDLSALVPSSTDEQTLIIVGIDKASNTPASASGDTVTETNNNIQYVPFTDAQIDAVTYPADFMAGGAVRLYNGMTNIQHWDCFKDVREWLSGGGGGSMTSFTVAGDSGTPQTIEDSNTLSILGGTALSSVASATDTVTLNLDNTAVTPGAYTSADITIDAQGRITAAANGASGTMSSFDINGDSGTPQTITNGNTLLIAGGTGIDTVVGATDTLTVSIDSTVVTLTGSQILTNKTLTLPTIGDFTNATHTHQNNAGGGTLDAAAIASGTLDNARVNWAAPGTIGSGTPNTGDFTRVSGIRGTVASMTTTTSAVYGSGTYTGTGSELATLVSFEFNDARTATNLSNQTLRFVYNRNSGATAIASAADYMMTLNAFINENHSGTMYGAQLFGPSVASGKTMATYRALSIVKPASAGTVTSYIAIEISGISSTQYSIVTYDGIASLGGTLAHTGTLLGFYNTTAIAKPTVTGSRGGNAALASLLTQLANLGLITNSTS